jgi:hypothetical protein
VQNLPQANFDLLRRVAEHLDKYVTVRDLDSTSNVNTNSKGH